MAQPHRQQVIALLGEARPGKAQQQAARLDPFADALLLGRRIGTGVGIDQHRDLALQQIGGAAAAHLGERPERAFEVVVFAEQRLTGGVRRRGDADRAAPPALVDQQHPASRFLALDLDPRHPVAQFGRQ